MTRTIRSLADAARHGMFVVATCRDCKREARFLASDLAEMFGYGRSLSGLRFKCTRCDSRNCEVKPELPGFERQHETVVWRPVKVKG